MYKENVANWHIKERQCKLGSLITRPALFDLKWLSTCEEMSGIGSKRREEYALHPISVAFAWGSPENRNNRNYSAQ